MAKFINSNAAFGETGEFEAVSREALAEELNGSFKIWATEYVQGNDGYEGTVEDRMAEIRAEFINGLEEIN